MALSLLNTKQDTTYRFLNCSSLKDIDDTSLANTASILCKSIGGSNPVIERISVVKANKRGILKLQIF